MKSFQVFQQFITVEADGTVDASGILSKPCYVAWLASRQSKPKYPEEAFRKTLTSHCRGDEGMRPFEPQVEAAVLALLRRKQIWPCFKGTSFKIGSRGYQVKGYWETYDMPNSKGSKKRKSAAKDKTMKKVKTEPFSGSAPSSGTNTPRSSSLDCMNVFDSIPFEKQQSDLDFFGGFSYKFPFAADKSTLTFPLEHESSFTAVLDLTAGFVQDGLFEDQTFTLA